MDKEVKAKWVSALRGGEVKQCRRFLHDSGSFCCIGVLATVQGVDFKADSRFQERDDIQTSWLPPSLRAGLDLDMMNRLANMNDEGKTFAEIADYIEKEIPCS